MKMKGAFMVFFRIGLVTLTTMVKTAHCHDRENAQIVIQAKKIERDAVNGIMYGNFRKHEFRRLSPRGRKETVAGITKPIDCTKSCLIAFWCWSYNLKRKANPDGTFLCELLSTHMYEKESKEEFRPDRDFDHHSIETACDETPCQNGGTCAPLYIEDDYNCTCTQGFTGKRCDQDKDECSLGSHDCHVHATCKNTYGSHNCTCKDGFEGDGKTCTDVNECAANEKHNCHGSASCHNTVGSFKCVCKSGFKLDKNGECVDEDECTQGDKCHVRATCTNTYGSFNCTCNDGFEGDGVTKCEDVNECTSSKHNCRGDAVCNNTVGSFACVCKSGFKSDGNGACQDEDECVLGSHKCLPRARCHNTHGSYHCTCKGGFQGDGVTSCNDVNECTSSKHNCSGDTVCNNTVGSFVCVCKSGFKNDGKGGCEDIDECFMGSHNCHSKANCINTRGSYNCTCKDGYKGDAVTDCAEIDQCSLCDSNADCDENKCKCKDNYIGDGRHCFGEDGDCKHLKNNREFKYNGWYRIRAKNKKSYMAYCQMETEGGQHPWTVFQRRVNGNTSFSKGKRDYEHGFGDGSNIWLGLKALHEFSKREGSLNLLVEVEDWEGNKANALYTNFEIEGGGPNHKHYMNPSLTFSSGTAGDSLSYHKHQKFSYTDEDNDDESDKHCAQGFQAGWWFKKCPPASSPPYWSNLNGQYLGNTDNIHGIIWTSFKGKLSLKSTEMKFQFSD